jgi:hypothetical protein
MASKPVRNSSPAIAGLETERDIISNGVNLTFSKKSTDIRNGYQNEYQVVI